MMTAPLGALLWEFSRSRGFTWICVVNISLCSVRITNPLAIYIRLPMTIVTLYAIYRATAGSNIGAGEINIFTVATVDCWQVKNGPKKYIFGTRSHDCRLFTANVNIVGRSTTGPWIRFTVDRSHQNTISLALALTVRHFVKRSLGIDFRQT